MIERISKFPPFGLRMPSRVKSWVEDKARELDRSQNYVIVRILEKEIAASTEMVEEARAIWGHEAAEQLSAHLAQKEKAGPPPTA